MQQGECVSDCGCHFCVRFLSKAIAQMSVGVAVSQCAERRCGLRANVCVFIGEQDDQRIEGVVFSDLACAGDRSQPHLFVFVVKELEQIKFLSLLDVLLHFV